MKHTNPNGSSYVSFFRQTVGAGIYRSYPLGTAMTGTERRKPMVRELNRDFPNPPPKLSSELINIF
jgi:hypothetical protein